MGMGYDIGDIFLNKLPNNNEIICNKVDNLINENNKNKEELKEIGSENYKLKTKYLELLNKIQDNELLINSYNNNRLNNDKKVISDNDNNILNLGNMKIKSNINNKNNKANNIKTFLFNSDYYYNTNIDVIFNHIEGDIDISLYQYDKEKKNYRRIRTSKSFENKENINFPSNKDTIYKLEVELFADENEKNNNFQVIISVDNDNNPYNNDILSLTPMKIESSINYTNNKKEFMFKSDEYKNVDIEVEFDHNCDDIEINLYQLDELLDEDNGEFRKISSSTNCNDTISFPACKDFLYKLEINLVVDENIYEKYFNLNIKID